jgi:hypothetical protein
MKKSTALIVAVLVIPLASWICRAVIVSVATPTADRNLVAYSLLVQASHANDVASAKTLAAQAASLASDQRLCSAAAAFSSICDSCLTMGVTTKTEANDLGGLVKSFLYGLGNPVGGAVESVKLLITGHKLDQQSAELDSIYIPQWNAFAQKSASAKSIGTGVMLVLLVAGWAGLWKRAKKDGSFPIRHTPVQTWVDVEPVLVVCDQCGARNRHKVPRPGQKLICGRCKTELAG